MSIVDRTLGLIDDGRSGRVLSIPFGLTKLDQFLFGIRQGMYYLIGAESGVGKTTFAREKFMHNAYEVYKRVDNPRTLDVQFVDFSLEITAEFNMGAAMARKAFLDYQKVIPVASLFGWDKHDGKLSDEDYRLIQAMSPYFRDFEEKMLVVDEETTPTRFHDTLMRVAERNGRFEREARWIGDRGTYTPFNPNKFVIVMIDTVNLSENDAGSEGVKSAIDAISKYARQFRNKCNFVIVMIQQFNAEISAVDRSRYGITTPLLRDFEDSKRTTKDASVVIGLYEPTRHMKDGNTTFLGYDLRKLTSWMRSAHILKNRYGRSNVYVPLKFDGAAGVFTQLPDALLMTEEEYTKATTH